MSQNMMVSWRRSADGAFGVEATGETRRATSGGEARFAPHLEQNFAFAEFACPQPGHDCGNAAPHCSQKLLPSGTSAVQLGHCIAHAPFGFASAA
jgi:hypothetical protein